MRRAVQARNRKHNVVYRRRAGGAFGFLRRVPFVSSVNTLQLDRSVVPHVIIFSLADEYDALPQIDRHHSLAPRVRPVIVSLLDFKDLHLYCV